MKQGKIKKRLKAILSGYDIEKTSLNKNKGLIIESILNRGGDEEIEWLLKNYKKEEILSVLRNPSRGLWEEKSLNFWLKIFNVKISKRKYEKAIRKIFIKAS